MSTIIRRSFAFKAAVFFEGAFLINNYDISLTLDVETDSIKEQLVAMDRLKYLFQELLSNCVFVQESENKVIENYQKADIKVCTVPEEPYDQIITILILAKANAITEGKLEVSDIELLSDMSDEVSFIYDSSILSADTMFNKYGWWNDAGMTISSKPKPNKREKIVKLSSVAKTHDWAAVGLDWKQKETACAEVIFTPQD